MPSQSVKASELDANINHITIADNMNRFAPVPGEIGRLERCIQELQTGKSPLPPGLPHTREAMREYLWRCVFPGIDQPDRLHAEEASRLTKVAGRTVTLQAVRQEVLNDIEDLVTYLASLSGEETREQSNAHIPFTQEDDASNAFNDQLSSVGGRDRYRTQAQSPGGDLLSNALPVDQRRNVKTQSTADEVLSLSKARLTRLRIPQGSDLQDDSPTPRQYTVSEHALGVGLSQERSAPLSKSKVPFKEPKVTQTAPGPFAYGVPSQHLTLGGFPVQMYAGAFGGQMSPAPNPWMVQQSPYGAYQSIPYASPWQQVYGQPASAYGQPPVAAYMPPPMPNPYIQARPAATNRVARLYSQPNAFQLSETAQTRPSSQNTEWQNRFVLQQAVVPDVPVLPYRVGSDDMYPIPSGTASVRYQNLTRDDPPNIDLASAEENVPFAENAKLMKPPQWGVMKIGNVSKAHLDRHEKHAESSRHSCCKHDTPQEHPSCFEGLDMVCFWSDCQTILTRCCRSSTCKSLH